MLILGLLYILEAKNAYPSQVHDDSLKAQLGRKLFFNTALSSPPGQSCASCHSPKAAFSDPNPNSPTSAGAVTGRFGARNTPTLMYAAFSTEGFFLDGRAKTLEEQAKGPLLNPLEMNNSGPAEVIAKVRAEYGPEFEEVYGRDVWSHPEQAFEQVMEAIATFERTATFSPFSSKYDAFLAGKATLTLQESRGLALFENPTKANCAACHPSQKGPNGESPLFTDFTYDNLGVPKNPAISAATSFIDLGLGGVTGQAEDRGKFKVPTLRNVALTGPYTHNGYFQSLRQVIQFYNTRDIAPTRWPAPEIAETVNREELGNLGLSDQDVDDLMSFLMTLTDGWRATASQN